jgi:DNA-binding NtrC family response regulator
VQEKERILVVDDSRVTLEVLERNLTSQGYQVFCASSVVDAIAVLEENPVDLVVTDMKMPRVSGLDLIRHVRGNFKDVEIMMITGYPSIEGAVEAVKDGADAYLPKPFTDEELLDAVRHALDKLQARQKVDGSAPRPAPDSFGLLGSSSAMQEVRHSIRKAASTTATVLILGESGTGKELVARAIHYSGPRAPAPFVPVNCGGIPEELLESELFGHLKGAFTGATESRAGFFQTADGGTIFLDEVNETTPAMQVKLLRVLQDKEVYMVGSRDPRKVDVRIVATSNRDLLGLIHKGTFREDLFFRLNVISITVPPLRERGDDIFLLIHHYAAKFADEMGKPIPAFSDRALQAFRTYDWPGNVRELENVIQRLVVMTDGDTLDVPDLPPVMRFSAPRGRTVNQSLAAVEAAHIRDVLVSVGGNKTRAAKILGIDRKTLRKKNDE